MEPIVWTGDLNDDCTAIWNGLMLRCEIMSSAEKKRKPSLGTWWWCVYDDAAKDSTTGSEVSSSNTVGSPIGMTGEQARYYCEMAAKAYLWEREHNV